MDIKNLRQFLIDSNQAGYASGQEKKWIKEADGSTTIPFEKGDWKSHDNFFGGEPYGGRTIVFYKEKPVWIMVYYGWATEEVETNPIYQVLRNALMKMPQDHPFRGPGKYQDGEYIYTNLWSGELERFFGEEKIIQNDKLVYKANYLGGLVDQRRGI
ncbi:hypothetical protein HY388_00030 [Candidatus Daviesbacteria bacterium]|nr:hypothetical protein [Candidatus Daviesbacteria bacterium]